MNELVTTDTILSTMKGWVEEKQAISPSLWIDASAKLVVLMGDESDKLFDLMQKVAQMKADYLTEGDTSAAAKTKVERTDEYKDMLKQKAKIDRIEEFIRISKIQARLRDQEWGHQS